MNLECGPRDARYGWGTGLSMAFYGLAVAGVSVGVNQGWLKGWPLYAASILPGVAITAQLVFTLDLFRRTDEFLRALMAKRFIVASCLTFAIWSVWGFLETFAGVTHLPGWLAYAVMWFFFGASALFIKSSK
nr:hypothetical protein [uncultured Brevundimonas sp.]